MNGRPGEKSVRRVSSSRCSLRYRWVASPFERVRREGGLSASGSRLDGSFRIASGRPGAFFLFLLIGEGDGCNRVARSPAPSANGALHLPVSQVRPSRGSVPPVGSFDLSSLSVSGHARRTSDGSSRVARSPALRGATGAVACSRAPVVQPARSCVRSFSVFWALVSLPAFGAGARVAACGDGLWCQRFARSRAERCRLCLVRGRLSSRASSFERARTLRCADCRFSRRRVPRGAVGWAVVQEVAPAVGGWRVSAVERAPPSPPPRVGGSVGIDGDGGGLPAALGLRGESGRGSARAGVVRRLVATVARRAECAWQGDGTSSPSGAPDWVTWLILPVVICLSQRLSHACPSMNASYCETANGSLNQL